MPDEPEKDLQEKYESRSADLQRSFVILVGFGLFFLFMILVPFYALKHDSTAIGRTEWLNDNTSHIITMVDEILNSSKVMDNDIQKYIDASNKPVSDIKDYANSLDSIRYFNQTLRMTAGNNLIQNVMGKLIIYSTCVDKIKINEWVDCNLKEAIAKTATDMYKSFNKTATNVNDNIIKIDKAVIEINKSNDKLNKQISFSGNSIDVSEINNLLQSARVIINNTANNLTSISQKLDSTAKIRPSSPLDFYLVYPGGQVYGFDALRLIVSDILSSNQKSILEHLKNELDEIKMKITTETEKLEGRFNQFQSPLGNIPIGFNEAVGIFSFALGAGFSVYIYLLIQTSRLRKELLVNFNRHYLYLQSRIDRHVSMFSPLWIDLCKAKRKQIVQIIILCVPFLIFITAFVMVMHIIFLFDNPFPFAVNVNKYLYSILSVVGLILFICSYVKVFTVKI
jgi:hypothetical protein